MLQLKRSVDGIPPRSPAQPWLYRDDQLRGHSMALGECGYTGRGPTSALLTLQLDLPADRAGRAAETLGSEPVEPFSDPAK